MLTGSSNGTFRFVSKSRSILFTHGEIDRIYGLMVLSVSILNGVSSFVLCRRFVTLLLKGIRFTVTAFDVG